MLLADGTYYVLEVDGELVACGGWSRRNPLHRQWRVRGATASCSTRPRAGARTGDVRPRRLDTTRPRPAHHRGVRDRGPPRGFPATRAPGHTARRTAISRLRLRADRGTRASSPRRRQDPLRLDGEVDRPWGVPGLSDRRVAFPNGARLSPPRPPTALKSAIPSTHSTIIERSLMR